MKKKFIIFFCIIFGLIILSSNFVVASQNFYDFYKDNTTVNDLNTEIEANQEKIDNLKKATEEYEQKIGDYKNQSATLKNQLALLDNQIIKIELDIKSTQIQIDKSKLEIKSMEYQIEKEDEEIEKHKTNLSEYIKLINKNDQKSYLEILILNESFSEFFNELNYLEEIQNDIFNSLERLKLLKTAMEVQKAHMDMQKQGLEELKLQQKLKQEKSQYDIKAKEILILETKSSEIVFERLLVETKQRQNEIDSDILNIKDQITNKISQLRSGNSTPKTTLLTWPIPPPHYITAYFHDPDYPYRYIFEHPAIDIRAKQGTAITAPAPGYVARAKDAGYGYSYIILIHDNGISTVYGHVSSIYVNEDQYVQLGDVIGLSGGMPGTRGAGNLSTGPHLHLETRLNGLPVNPLEYLP